MYDMQTYCCGQAGVILMILGPTNQQLHKKKAHHWREATIIEYFCHWTSMILAMVDAVVVGGKEWLLTSAGPAPLQ